MKKIKSGIALSVALLLAAGLFSGCGKDKAAKSDVAINETGFPIVNEKLEMSMMGVTNAILCEWSENLFFKEMEAKTNIAFTFTVMDDSTYAEKKNLAFASGDLPDVFFKSQLNNNEVARYGEQGYLLPLEELIDKYAPNLKKLMEENADIKEAITTPDGHIYALPSIDPSRAHSTIVLNKKWLEKLGMSMPTSTDEFYDVLYAFKNNDPNGNGQDDEIPITLSSTENIKRAFFPMFGMVSGENNMSIIDGKAEFIPFNKNFKEALTYLNKLCADGLLDSETFTQTSQELNAKGKSETELLGGMFTPGAFLHVGEERHFDYDSFTPFVNSDGTQVAFGSSGIATGAFAISKNCPSPEAAIRWVDYLYGEEGGRLAQMGVEGKTYKMNDDGSWDWILSEGQEQNDLRGKETIQPGASVPQLIPVETWNKIQNIYEASLADVRGKVTPYTVPALPQLYFTADDLKDVNSISADLNTYVNEMIAKFILGQESIDNIDAFISKCKDMKADELVSIYQKTYDSTHK
ncbi:MAG: extracellular solute-binding protein [Clostridia bacterium]|nr:extracellular solute-binding protein [Clostridia bacterium]